MGSPIAFQEIFKAWFDDFVIPVYEVAPFTTIVNRAMVTRSLKAIAGVERIMCKGISLLQNEFGANGERVFESSDKDARIRFVGNWFNTANNQGSRPVTTTALDYAEITFYGTGLNMMINIGNGQDIRAQADGGAEGVNLVPASISNVLNARNYGNNTIVGIASNLALGWHTVRINHKNAAGLPFYGFEILNERTDLAVYQGSAIVKGSVSGLNALATSPFNSGVVGTRGARVVKHVLNGALSQSVQEVNNASAFLTAADHTNEEVVRRINFREFGANRADDFSTLAGIAASRAFTLDDGTTTLVGSAVIAAGNLEGVGPQNAGGFITLTFVGTGLDIMEAAPFTITAIYDVAVDGVVVASSIALFTSSLSRIRICSGLPYGTHNVKITRVSGTTGAVISDFIIYQPKKPVIPVGAIEVADYNVMASYVVSPAFTVTNISTGVLRKSPTRERVYVNGTWFAIINVLFPSGHGVWNSVGGAYLEFSFFGTGVEIKGLLSSGDAINRTYSLNGNANLTGYTIGVNGATGLTFTAATGVLSGTPTTSGNYGETIFIRGLPLGHYTLRATYNSGYTFYNDTIDVITPIHINETSLKIGSQSLRSNTNYDVIKSQKNLGPDLSKAKAWVVFDAVNARILKSFGVSAILVTGTGIVNIYFDKSFKDINYVIAYQGGVSQSFLNGGSVAKKTNFVTLTTTNTTGTVGNSEHSSVIFFGEQIDE